MLLCRACGDCQLLFHICCDILHIAAGKRDEVLYHDGSVTQFCKASMLYGKRLRLADLSIRKKGAYWHSNWEEMSCRVFLGT